MKLIILKLSAHFARIILHASRSGAKLIEADDQY
jgi:hypothetical protein